MEEPEQDETQQPSPAALFSGVGGGSGFSLLSTLAPAGDGACSLTLAENIMNTIYRLLVFFGIAAIAYADFSADGVPAAPDILTRIIAGAESSGEPLQSKGTKGEATVYYLRSAEYIGECVAPFGTVHIAQLFFIRSGVRGQQTPPPRGHTFLVFYDADFKVRGYWRDPGGPFRVDGSKLIEGDKELFDYTKLPKHINVVHGQWPHPPIWK